MGINMGAFFGALVTGYLAQDVNFRAWLAGHGLDPHAAWHWGFGAAGVGMTLGLLQYVLGSKHLGSAGLHPVPASSAESARLTRRVRITLGVLLLALLLFGVGVAARVIPVSGAQINRAVGYLQILIAIPFFAWLLFDRSWTREERHQLYAIVVYFVAAAIFFSVYEQAGSTLNLFADRNTRTELLGRPFPSSWFQSLNPLLIFALAPVFAWLWVKLGRRQPSTPAKFGLGLVGVGLGFLIMVPAARMASADIRVSVLWLVATYVVHTLAELCLSPVGLSAMTKLAPARIVGLMMGVWFLGASVGSYIAGNLASLYETWPLPDLLGSVGLVGVGAGVVMLALTPRLKRLVAE
jgi:POT family proton-dependent oligopeptide transporter